MDIKTKANELLVSIYGGNTTFREGQLEAIESVYNGNKTLVVQKTGWGKSLIYFLTTKLFREEKKGFTLVISPLLVLMENQIDSANKFGLRCISVNSYLKGDERDTAIEDIANDLYDVVFITPESLFSKDIQKSLIQFNINLFVIDEAHCISDWGHDFRPEYYKIRDLLKYLPNTRVLATTATANNRVVADLEEQLGGNITTLRGNLTRDKLSINIIDVDRVQSRYAWIYENINKLPNSGIIYCSTTRDCDRLSLFLREQGIPVLPYHSDLTEEEQRHAEKSFMNDEIKALVATIKLGMGYDKSNIGFIIHYQRPSNVVSYYQQIGRAGRDETLSYAILMNGHEDTDISEFFINTAFPTEEQMTSVYNAIKDSTGITVRNIQYKFNIAPKHISKSLTFLVNNGNIYKEGSKYYVSATQYKYNREYYEKITNIRKNELNVMSNLLNVDTCLSKYIVNELDDYNATECGVCSICSPNTLSNLGINMPNKDSLDKSKAFLENNFIDILPRKRYPDNTKIENINEKGLCLSVYGESGIGLNVKEAKYNNNKESYDILLGHATKVLKRFTTKNNIKHITQIPSTSSDFINKFVIDLANKLNITYVECFTKEGKYSQKRNENSYYQYINAVDSYQFTGQHDISNSNILLIDDIIDSKWTMTVCGNLLSDKGYGKVFPFTLAISTVKE